MGLIQASVPPIPYGLVLSGVSSVRAALSRQHVLGVIMGGSALVTPPGPFRPLPTRSHVCGIPAADLQRRHLQPDRPSPRCCSTGPGRPESSSEYILLSVLHHLLEGQCNPDLRSAGLRRAGPAAARAAV